MGKVEDEYPIFYGLKILCVERDKINREFGHSYSYLRSTQTEKPIRTHNMTSKNLVDYLTSDTATIH